MNHDSTVSISATERAYLRRCVDLAQEAVEAGDEPYGSLLTDPTGTVRFEDRNRVKDGDATRHPEFAIARWAAENLSPEERGASVVFTSGEHCPMCSAAHAMVGLGRIVYASSSEEVSSWYQQWGVTAGPVAPLPIQVVATQLQVIGPVAEFTEEIRGLHARMLGVQSPD
ncbi:nucleoside deaminase [Arthrobacter roseus]|uniref:nucleoside deaminase n=1 Tax=Arthrobacter roseus TaxID=136274 RepID=UPI001964544F|nr:nucleoside deaminase [Arthrobacter roseus]MBM7849452.1 tRNA(Arg) A34 adenosine deaminase TadA [Arthrobacter roseus]